MSPRIFDFLIDKNIFLSRPRTRPIPSLIKKPKSQTPLITLSRLTGSGGRKIADLVTKDLGKPWKVWDKEIMDVLARETQKSKDFFRDFDERVISSVEEYIDDFFGKQIPIFSKYEQVLLKVLTTIGHSGYAIIVGRGGNFLFPESLRVRVVASSHVRLQNMLKFEPQYTREQSQRWMRKTDRNRDEFVKKIFDKDPADPLYYDVVINTDKIPLKEAADIVVTLARHAFFK